MILALTTTFAASFFSFLALFFVYTAIRHSPAAELKKRLRRMAEAGDEVSPDVAELLKEISPAERAIFRLPLLRNLQRLIVHSGVRKKPLVLFLLMMACTFAAFVLMFVVRNSVVVALLSAALVPAGFVLYLQQLKRQRERRFTEQLPDALTMIARSLRAGHSFVGSIELLAQELAMPASELFRTAYEQQKLGMRITDALALLLDRIESVDLRFFVTIVNINNEVGGNLAEILEKLAETIRSRLQVRRQVQVYTAQGRMSGYILAILPVVLFVAIYLMQPDYMDIFFRDRRSQYILVTAFGMEIIGFVVIRKIIDIRI